MIVDLEKKVNELYLTPSDINEHFPIIIKYGSACEHITEMGVRGIVSTWGWLACAPKKLICYDLQNPAKWGGNLLDVQDTAIFHNVDFTFHEADVLNLEIEETDLLFIDTWHVYDQLKRELELHPKKVRKYLVFHDTTSYENHNETSLNENNWKGPISGKQGLWLAIQEFLESTDEWVLEERHTNNNGFTILKRVK